MREENSRTYASLCTRWDRYKARVEATRERMARIIIATLNQAVVHRPWSTEGKNNNLFKDSVSALLSLEQFQSTDFE